MGTNIGRGDNLMREMAREVNMLNNDAMKEQNVQKTARQRKIGIVIMVVLLIFLAVILGLFIF